MVSAHIDIIRVQKFSMIIMDTFHQLKFTFTILSVMVLLKICEMGLASIWYLPFVQSERAPREKVYYTNSIKILITDLTWPSVGRWILLGILLISILGQTIISLANEHMCQWEGAGGQPGWIFKLIKLLARPIFVWESIIIYWSGDHCTVGRLS